MPSNISQNPFAHISSNNKNSNIFNSGFGNVFATNYNLSNFEPNKTFNRQSKPKSSIFGEINKNFELENKPKIHIFESNLFGKPKKNDEPSIEKKHQKEPAKIHQGFNSSQVNFPSLPNKPINIFEKKL